MEEQQVNNLPLMNKSFWLTNHQSFSKTLSHYWIMNNYSMTSPKNYFIGFWIIPLTIAKKGSMILLLVKFSFNRRIHFINPINSSPNIGKFPNHRITNDMMFALVSYIILRIFLLFRTAWKSFTSIGMDFKLIIR